MQKGCLIRPVEYLKKLMAHSIHYTTDLWYIICTHRYIFKFSVVLSPSLTMSGPKKRKVDSECRVFNKERTAKYFFTEIRSKAVCLICQETTAVFKEYIISLHFSTKHANYASNVSALKEKYDSLKVDKFYASLNETKTFSMMNNNKASHRSQLTDEHLRSVLRIATTKLTPNFAKKGDQQHCSH